MFVFRSGPRPRNPLLRLIGSLLGLFAVLGVLALGMFAFAALVVFAGTWLLISALRGKPLRAGKAAAPKADSGVIDGEFTVVRDAEPRAVIERATTPATQGRHG